MGALVTASENQVAANLLLNVPLVAPVAWAQAWHAADNRHIAEVSAVDVRRQLATVVARAYLTVMAQHRVITANENARNTAQAHYDYAHTRLVGGIGRSIDEVRAEQELRTNEVAGRGRLRGAGARAGGAGRAGRRRRPDRLGRRRRARASRRAWAPR